MSDLTLFGLAALYVGDDRYALSCRDFGSRRDQALRRLAAVNEPPRPDDERPRDERGTDIESAHATWCSDACCSCDIPF